MQSPNATTKQSVRADYLAFGRPDFSEEEFAAVNRVMRSGWVGMGPEVIAFEKELEAFTAAKNVVTLSSCTSALHLSLLICGVGPGDEVIVPSFTWCSSANAALYLGARPVFCDIDRDSLCLTPETILGKLTRRTKAVVVVHFGGLAVDVAEIRKHLPARVAIVEDAAHALGAAYPNGRPVGSSGNPVCFSFYANKNLSTADGGAIAISKHSSADRLRSLRQHALPINAWKRFSNPRVILMSPKLKELGFKMNYTDLQAAMGRVQLRRQAEFSKRRLKVAQVYVSRLAELPFPVRIQSSCLSPGHARHLFTVQFPWNKLPLSRKDFILSMRARNLGVTIHYAPLHKMPLYSKRNQFAQLPNSEAAGRSIVTLPIGPCITPGDANQLIDSALDLLKC
jgi:perosamine synthetase